MKTVIIRGKKSNTGKELKANINSQSFLKIGPVQNKIPTSDKLQYNVYN